MEVLQAGLEVKTGHTVSKTYILQSYTQSYKILSN